MYTPAMPEPPIWIDSHAHLGMFERDEIDGVLARAAARRVEGVLVPATGRDDLDLTIGIAADNPGVVAAAVGVHPHEASSLDDALKGRIEASLTRPGVVAVGEIGLDYHYMNSPREQQLRALEWQLDLACEAGLPVVLHNRESWVDLERSLAAREGRLRGVCHSFTEGPEEARRVTELGLTVGISGMVPFKAADNIRRMVASLQPQQVLVETDSPFLAPVPHRGARNEPSYVPLIGRRLAEEWGVSVDQVAAWSTSACKVLFAWPG
jgi:TatD DNase family protein